MAKLNRQRERLWLVVFLSWTALAWLAARKKSKPQHHIPPVPTPRDKARAQKLLAAVSQSSEDYFKLWPHDKTYFWSAQYDGFVAYKVVESIAFAIPDPIAHTPAQAQAILKEFIAYCRSEGWRVCFVAVPESSLPLYHDAQLKNLAIGASALVDIQTFTSATLNNKWWRWKKNRAEKLGYKYEYVTPPHSTSLLSDLRAISNTWLKANHHHEQGFLLGYFDEEYLQQCTLHLLRNQQSRVVAFANELPRLRAMSTATTDLVRYDPSAPDATPYLMQNMIKTINQQSTAAYFDLGFVPLARMKGLAPSITRRLGARRFSARGLEQFKNKFQPTWHPNHAVFDGGITDIPAIALRLIQALEAPRSQPSIIKEENNPNTTRSAK